jgi:predicted metalloprotease with PDZ domain
MHYAREHRLPLIALNASQELTRQISESGMDALPEALRAQLPDQYDRSDLDYEQRLKGFFGSHPGSTERSFDRFLDVQLTWDESMAQAAAEYLRAHPGHRMAILAGSGHVAYRSGIPNRLQRRLGPNAGEQIAVILVGSTEWPAEAADYLVLSRPQELPPAGLLGAFLDDKGEGLKIVGFSTDSPLEDAGVSKDDTLLKIDDQQVADFAALKIALMDRRPGEVVQVSYRHVDFLGREHEKSAPVTLQGKRPQGAHP